jgi:hypothetical protein
MQVSGNGKVREKGEKIKIGAVGRFHTNFFVTKVDLIRN